MKKALIIILIILNTAAINSCSDQKKNNNDSLINSLKYQYEFIQKDIPTEEEADRLHWMYDDTPFLAKKGDKLLISDYEYTSIKSFTVLGPDELGNFVAADYGEFGRYLCYIGSYEYEVNSVYEVNTVADDFYILNDDRSTIYCVYGFAHMSFAEGKITRITSVDGKWQRDEDFEIYFEDDSIEAFCVENDTVYIATLEKLIKIKGDKIEQILVEDAFWRDLYPNSIVCIDDTLYIGMRGGIASYALKTGELLWYEQTTD